MYVCLIKAAQKGAWYKILVYKQLMSWHCLPRKIWWLVLQIHLNGCIVALTSITHHPFLRQKANALSGNPEWPLTKAKIRKSRCRAMERVENQRVHSLIFIQFLYNWKCLQNVHKRYLIPLGVRSVTFNMTGWFINMYMRLKGFSLWLRLVLTQ